MLRLAIPLVTLLALMAAFSYYPSVAGTAALAVFLIGFSLSTVSTLRGQSRLFRDGRIDRRGFVRNSLVKITGLLLTLAASAFLGRLAIGYITTQLEGTPGFILGMLAAMVTGLGIGLLVQSTWGRLVKRPTSV